MLHFKPLRYDHWSQALEVTLGEVMPSGEPPLLKKRRELTREQAIKLWNKKRQQGWRACPPQWAPPPEVRPPARRPAASMGGTGTPPCF